MSSTRQLNHLFYHNPPTEEGLIEKLFCNRDAELRFGLDRLRAPIAAGMICAVHGLPRSGKSHFVHRLLLDAKAAGLPYVFLTVNANNRGTARAVLEEVYFKLMDRLRAVPDEQVPEGQTGVRAEYLEYLAQYEDVVGRDSVEFKIERTSAVATIQGLGVKVLPRPFEISLVDQSETRSANSHGVVQRSLGEHELVEILRYGMDALSWLYDGKKVLLFVDDLDLLDRKGKEGQPESDLLVDHLKALAEPGTLTGQASVVVLATIRQASFTDRDKDFQDFVEVTLLDPEHHRAIYKRHIDLFNAGEPIFTDEALEWIEEGAAGQVGMFLRRCHQVWQRFYGRVSEGTKLDREHIRQYVQTHVRQLIRDDSSQAALDLVIAAVRDGQSELVMPGAPSQGGLLFTVLTPLGGRGRYSINPIYFDVIREQVKKGLIG